jgi:hypothetical protein
MEECMMNYRILEVAGNGSGKDLAKNVNALIKEGWKPQGGVSISLANIDGMEVYSLAQAMIKE